VQTDATRLQKECTVAPVMFVAPRRGRAESSERCPGFSSFARVQEESGAALADSLCPGVEELRRFWVAGRYV